MVSATPLADLSNLDPEQKIEVSLGELQGLLQTITQGGGILPPGAMRRPNGTVFRTVKQPTGRLRPIKGPDGKPTGRSEIVYRLVERDVYLTSDYSPGGLVLAKRAAYRSQMDFYHPEYGWLRNGCKREVDVTENLGDGAQAYQMVYEEQIADDEAGTSATAQGVPMVDADTSTEDPASPASSGLASWDEALVEQGDVPRVGGRTAKRGHSNGA